MKNLHDNAEFEMATIEDIEEVRKEFPNLNEAMIHYIANYENEVWEDIASTKIIGDMPTPDKGPFTDTVMAMFIWMKLEDNYIMPNILAEINPDLFKFLLN
ncbi:hypothetical protein JTB14_028864 [Gonioctena quinquepunctata]|nr:hypothetical protein JTB14_028864 [Gonioctena quinquepunctata]